MVEDNDNDAEQSIADADDLALPLDKWAQGSTH